jgi:hypothetical protein
MEAETFERLANNGIALLILGVVAWFLWGELRTTRTVMLNLLERSIISQERTAASQDALVKAVDSNTDNGAHLRQTVDQLRQAITDKITIRS